MSKNLTTTLKIIWLKIDDFIYWTLDDIGYWKMYYRVKDFFFPHNVIKVKRLGRNFVDKDVLMFHAMFQLLVDFIEKERPAHYLERDIDDYWREPSKELWNLYLWYKHLTVDDFNNIYDSDGVNEVSEMTKKMHQLVRLSGYMWT